MKKSLIAAVAIIASSPVLAADLPATVSLYDWTGFYLGAHVGGSWSGSSGTTINTLTGAVVGTGSSTESAFHGGGQIGYDYMFSSRVVLGVSASLQSGASSTTTTSNAAATIVNTEKGTTVISGSVLGRLGYGFDNFLPYITGGWGWSSGNNVRTQVLGVVGLAGPGTAETAYWMRSGWTVGGGVEYAFSHNWSVFAEYRHTGFGAITNTFPIAQRASTATTYANAVTAGINYRF